MMPSDLIYPCVLRIYAFPEETLCAICRDCGAGHVLLNANDKLRFYCSEPTDAANGWKVKHLRN